jgi:hypothetical protein
VLSPNAFLRYLTAGPKYLGATTIEEQAWCRWFAAEVYSAQGAIVELGPWLGSLTTSYCEGLERNPGAAAREKFAFVYDLFEWSAIFEEWARDTPHAGRFSAGESFEDHFRRLFRPYDRFLTIVRSDLSNASWTGGPIEFLINDAAKSLHVADAIFRAFVPWMIPGKSYVAHQDFLWSTDAYIQVFMFLARDSFVYEHTVPGSTMAVFRNVRRFDPARLRGYDVAGRLDRDLIVETFAWSVRTVTDVNPALLYLCQAVVLRDFGYLDDARRLVANHSLQRPVGDGQYDYQLETLRSWGYTDLLPRE